MILPIYVSSSIIDAVGYMDSTLYIRFRSGTSYAYPGVPYTVFDALQKVESAGKFFNKIVRNHFRHTKLTTDPFTGVQERRKVEIRTVERRTEGRRVAGRRVAERRPSLH